MADILRVAARAPDFRAAIIDPSRRDEPGPEGAAGGDAGAKPARSPGTIRLPKCPPVRSSSSPTSSSTRCRSASSSGAAESGASASSASTIAAGWRSASGRACLRATSVPAEGQVLEIRPAADAIVADIAAPHCRRERRRAHHRLRPRRNVVRRDAAGGQGACAIADPLDAPGETDLTAHVDFASAGRMRAERAARPRTGRCRRANFFSRSAWPNGPRGSPPTPTIRRGRKSPLLSTGSAGAGPDGRALQGAGADPAGMSFPRPSLSPSPMRKAAFALRARCRHRDEGAASTLKPPSPSRP